MSIDRAGPAVPFGTDREAPENFLEFTLQYSGELLSSTKSRAAHKQVIRRAFHDQLKYLWDTHPSLKDWTFRRKRDIAVWETVRWRDYLADKYRSGGRGFVPLVFDIMDVNCRLEIDVLLQESDKRRNDIDNRLGTIFDALRIPEHAEELKVVEESDANPFFCLLQDDMIIDQCRIKRMPLLRPGIGSQISQNHSEIIVRVDIKRHTSTLYNDIFA